jgi:hypothetical protein
MASALSDALAQFADQRYRALLAVSEAIVSHRDLSALFHELAGRLHHSMTILTDFTHPEQPEVLAVADGRDEAAAG